ncbi:hypothetical protein Lalb_Chr11g0075401 [Lupinus albus]|uniref:Uncharacterized protein n=1 Tax=Lupinus albus TaxID=3870 RepID=A0A6A4PTG2_LUPAL|nr:hypothetical protein Lalb_Chr11g0075401 [Lupinus albus]
MMLVSLEALAMAGASNVEFGMDIEEWENKDLEEYPPPHLLAEQEEEEEEEGDNNNENNFNYQEKVDTTMEVVRMQECMGSIKIFARALATLCMILCYITYKHNRFRILL